MKKILSIILSIVLLVCTQASLIGCSSIQAVDLMKGIEDSGNAKRISTNVLAADVTDFALRLFSESDKDGENSVISPISVLSALAMVMNGAEGETLAQMERCVGLDRETLNSFIYTYMSDLSSGENYKLNFANSVWFKDRDGFTVEKSFLQTNADYFGADVYKTPFDESTVEDINTWVNEKTDGLIPEMIESIDEDELMKLINTVLFDAEWQNIYEEDDVQDCVFILEDGTAKSAEFMYSTENKYLKDDYAEGFIKYYSSSRYAFAALLPNEGVSIDEYIDSLDGEKLNSILTGAQNKTVGTALPKFEAEFDSEMSDSLKSMGIADAFDYGKADFSSLGKSERGNIFIDSVLHKANISVDTAGTKAAGATSITMIEKYNADNFEEERVYLNRPFVYMLIDREVNIPFFIGKICDVDGEIMTIEETNEQTINIPISINAEKTTVEGRCVVNGSSYLIIENGSPIVMYNEENSGMFDGLTTGDLIRIVRDDKVMKSYPGHVTVYECTKLEDGDIRDIPSDVRIALSDLGWMSAETIVDTESPASETVSYEYKYANITLDVPDGWDYELTEYTKDCSHFGFTLYPEYKTDCTLTVMYYPGMFGVCGTGLSEVKTTLDGKAANAGYYDSSDIWNFIAVDDYAVVNYMPDATFELLRDDIDAILSSVKLGDKIIDQTEAIDIALTVSEAQKRDLAIGKFDYERGIWTVRFYTDDSFSSYSWCVDVDYEGNVVNMYIAEPAA